MVSVVYVCLFVCLSVCMSACCERDSLIPEPLKNKDVITKFLRQKVKR